MDGVVSSPELIVGVTGGVLVWRQNCCVCDPDPDLDMIGVFFFRLILHYNSTVVCLCSEVAALPSVVVYLCSVVVHLRSVRAALITPGLQIYYQILWEH